MHVSDILISQAAQRPDQPAVTCEDRVVTFAQLHRDSNRTANALLASGLRPGARVAFLGWESELFYDIVFACAASGIVLVPVNWRLTAREVEHILRDSRTELVFVDRHFASVIDEIRPALPLLSVVVPADRTGFDRWRAGRSEAAPARVTGPDDPCCQIYTSGTTGRPKGVVLAHRSFFNVSDGLPDRAREWVDWRPGDTGLVGMPGFHIGGLDFALEAMNAGCSIVSMPMFVSEEAVALVAEHRVNTMIVTPAMLHMMLAEPDADRATFASLRTVIYGGSPISEALLAECMRTLDCGLLQIYGSTESGNVMFRLPPREHVAGSPFLRSAGLPGPDVRAKVVDEDDRPVPTGTIGEVCVRAPSVMVEYWNNPEATARTLRDGWLHMGDVGYLDETGHLFLCARVNDTIIVAGENIYPAEIENALTAHPAVADAAVFGVPDEQWGERVHACVVLRPEHTATPRDLMRFLNGYIADFKVPTGYTFVAEVPRNATGKILRRELREQVLADARELVT